MEGALIFCQTARVFCCRFVVVVVVAAAACFSSSFFFFLGGGVAFFFGGGGGKEVNNLLTAAQGHLGMNVQRVDEIEIQNKMLNSKGFLSNAPSISYGTQKTSSSLRTH